MTESAVCPRVEALDLAVEGFAVEGGEAVRGMFSYCFEEDAAPLLSLSETHRARIVLVSAQPVLSTSPLICNKKLKTDYYLDILLVCR